VVTQFTIEVFALTEEGAAIEMDEITSCYLVCAGGIHWECVEDNIYPDPSWIPGFGLKNKGRGFKAFRKFISREDTLILSREMERG